jgi:hypothetical protein
VGVALVVVSGLGGILSGLFPANVNFGLHVFGALLNFLTASIGLLLLGIAVRKRNPRRATWSLALGAITIVGLVLDSNQIFLGLGSGGMERVIGYPSVVWAIGLGAALLVRAKRTARAASLRRSAHRRDRSRHGAQVDFVSERSRQPRLKGMGNAQRALHPAPPRPDRRS